ncbi:uncharacterized protein CLUP02_13011 [Colletotrichum lupini]|uniref:Uncharacterized protein n=1 Tax=Colletotrichum lupini TaxID=145971 RepID=A0A9Q8T3G3_9PEZI|nr:uncharacterized protein CLUP02_13011 [Colletotrichum lupini]UQC87506.1 hypothetical protein CLUP02_13011 [Colletotrichum lupini]
MQLSGSIILTTLPSRDFEPTLVSDVSPSISVFSPVYLFQVVEVILSLGQTLLTCPQP